MAAERQQMFATSVTGVRIGNLAIYLVTCGLRKTSSPSAGAGKVAGASMACHGKIIVLV